MKHGTGIYLRILCLIIIYPVLAFSLSCAGDSGLIVASDGTEMRGYLVFEECYDWYTPGANNQAVKFKAGRMSGWKELGLKGISRVVKDGSDYLIINASDIAGEGVTDGRIPVSIICRGSVSLYRYCSARYMNTMFSTRRMDVYMYLLAKKNGEKLFTVPQDSGQFSAFSAEHFSDCPDLVEEINRAYSVKNPEDRYGDNAPGNGFVEEQDIAGYVNRYNQCMESRN